MNRKAQGTKRKQAVNPPRVSLGATVTENLPLPLVYYPNHYGTFFAFAQDYASDVVMCACATPLVENLFRLIKTDGNQQDRSRIYDYYFPTILRDILDRWNETSPFPIRFAPRVCHRCNVATPTMRYCHEMYGTRFIQYFGWYLNQTYLRMGMLPGGARYLPDVCPVDYQTEIDEAMKLQTEYMRETERVMAMVNGPKRADIPDSEVTYWHNVRYQDAEVMVDLRQRSAQATRRFTTKIENIARQEFGFCNVGEGWVSETLLFQIVRRICPDEAVLFHHKPDWLAGLEIDVYLPALKTGFEYQGAQHFYPIKAWGGEQALEKVKQRDAKKLLLSQQHGVRLIAIDYTESLTEEFVRSLLFGKQL